MDRVARLPTLSSEPPRAGVRAVHPCRRWPSRSSGRRMALGQEIRRWPQPNQPRAPANPLRGDHPRSASRLRQPVCFARSWACPSTSTTRISGSSWATEAGQVTPGGDERLLGCIGRVGVVVEDRTRQPVAPFQSGGDQRVERCEVAEPGAHDERLVESVLACRAAIDPFTADPLVSECYDPVVSPDAADSVAVRPNRRLSACI